MAQVHGPARARGDGRHDRAPRSAIPMARATDRRRRADADLGSNAALRRLLRRRRSVGPGDAAARPTARRRLALLTKVIVPDAYLLSWDPWARRAIAAASREPRDRLPDHDRSAGFDAPARPGAAAGGDRRGSPISATAGCSSRRASRSRPPPQRALDALARATRRHPAPTRWSASPRRSPRISARGWASPAELIPNGWDPESVQSAVSARRAGCRRAQVHVRAHRDDQRPRGRESAPAASRAAAADRCRPGRWRADARRCSSGIATAEDLALLDEPRLARRSSVTAASSSAPTVLALQRARWRTAAADLRPTSSEATGKLFEYLGSGRPIIALAEDNEAARIVGETGTGVSVPPRDAAAIATQLRRAPSTASSAASYAPRGLERYSYPGPARLMARSWSGRVSARRSLRHRV